MTAGIGSWLIEELAKLLGISLIKHHDILTGEHVPTSVWVVLAVIIIVAAIAWLIAWIGGGSV